MAQSEVWKSFGADTDAGRLLQKLYKGLDHANGVKYPKLRTQPQSSRPDFLPCGGSVESSDPRAKTRTEAKVVVPKMGKPKRVRCCFHAFLVPVARRRIDVPRYRRLGMTTRDLVGTVHRAE